MNKTATKQRVKASGIRAIDQGTRYDITGKLRALTREIEREPAGVVRDVMVVISRRGKPNTYATIDVRTFGTCQESELGWMFQQAQNRVFPG